MKKPFQVGDRVRAYSWAAVYAGRVIRVEGDRVYLGLDGGGNLDFHPKQCRRLVRKERRRVWVKLPTDFHPQHRANGMVSVDPVDGWVEFIEVRRKKQ